MLKPKKVILIDGSAAWEISGRNGGRGSKQIKRRFPSLKLAQEFLDEFKDEKKKLRLGIVEVGSFHDTTFAKEADNWLSYIKHRASPGHCRRAEDNLKDFIRDYGNLEPNKITLEFLTGLQGRLKSRRGKKEKSTWTNATVNRYTESICAVLNFSAVQRRIPSSPVVGFKKLPENTPEMLFWDEEETGSFLAWASAKYCELSNKSRLKARKNYVAYLLALNTGMRAGEIWGLKPRDLVLDESGAGATIFVRRQFNAVEKQFMPLKGELVSDKDKSRHVPCPKELQRELQALIQFNRIQGDMPVFQSVNGKPVSHDSFVDRFERDVRRWGGRRIRFHDMRHTAATLMLAKGIDVKTVSEILGHEDLSTTMKYVHLLGNRIKVVSQSFSVLPRLKPGLRLISANP